MVRSLIPNKADVNELSKAAIPPYRAAIRHGPKGVGGVIAGIHEAAEVGQDTELSIPSAEMRSIFDYMTVI